MTEVLNISISYILKERIIEKLGVWDTKKVRAFIYEAIDKALNDVGGRKQ